MSSKTAIPTNFGAGGSGLSPNKSGGVPSLEDILIELQAVVNAMTPKWVKDAADAAAGTATAETAVHVVRGPGVVSGISFAPSAALTADATNKATITVARRRAGVSVTLATLTTDVAGGNWTAWIEKAFALSGVAGALVLASGDVITVAITKAGTGVVIPSGALIVDIDAPADAI